MELPALLFSTVAAWLAAAVFGGNGAHAEPYSTTNRVGAHRTAVFREWVGARETVTILVHDAGTTKLDVYVSDGHQLVARSAGASDGTVVRFVARKTAIIEIGVRNLGDAVNRYDMDICHWTDFSAPRCHAPRDRQ